MELQSFCHQLGVGHRCHLLPTRRHRRDALRRLPMVGHLAVWMLGRSCLPWGRDDYFRLVGRKESARILQRVTAEGRGRWQEIFFCLFFSVLWFVAFIGAIVCTAFAGCWLLQQVAGLYGVKAKVLDATRLEPGESHV